MNSKRLIFKSHGVPSEVLIFDDHEIPALQENEVLLKIHASPINPADLNYIEGTYGIKPELPATAGMECFATVVKSRSEKFSAEDAVMPLSKIGGWSEYAITSAENLIKLPSGLDPIQGAMLKVNPATAWLLLHNFADLEKGDWIALNASNSGVGQCVIQLAADLGIRTLCFLRNEELFNELTTLGATHVFPDSAEGYEAAKEIFGKDRAKLAFNSVGGDSALRLMKLLAYSGTHITFGAMARKPLTVPNGLLIFNDLRIRGLWVTKWMENAPKAEVEAVYAALADRIISGSLKQEVDSTFALSSFREALSRLDVGTRHGKVLFQNQPIG